MCVADAQRVYDASQSQEVTICGKKVQLSLYYHGKTKNNFHQIKDVIEKKAIPRVSGRKTQGQRCGLVLL